MIPGENEHLLFKYFGLMHKMNTAVQMKSEAVKAQDFEKASAYRDEEKKLMPSLREIGLQIQEIAEQYLEYELGSAVRDGEELSQEVAGAEQ
jgi:hypothetical protein